MSNRLIAHVSQNGKPFEELKATPGRAHRYSSPGHLASTNGTAFYLARDAAERNQKNIAALGKYVYGMATGNGGLRTENLGPPLYAKANG